MVNIALHISLKNYEQQCNGRAYPAIIPTAHVIAPYYCFQLFCRVIRTSSAVAVKQPVRYTIRLLGLCVIPTARGEKSYRFIREIPLILEPLVFLVQPLYLASQLPDLLRQAHCVFEGSLLYVQVAFLCRLHASVQRSIRYLQFLAGSLNSYFQRQL